MKIRRDFVTNSSSSSFVIAYKGDLPKIDEKVLEEYPYMRAFEKMMRNAIFGDTGGYETEEARVFDDLEEWDDYWIDENRYYLNDTWDSRNPSVENILKALDNREKEYGYSYQDEKDSYLIPAKYLKEGYKVMEKRVSYDDDWLSNLLRDLEDDENFIILRDSER